EVVIPHDPVNEQVILAAAITDPEWRAGLCARLRPDHFIAPAHHDLWSAIREAERRHLACDPATILPLARASGSEADPSDVADHAAPHPASSPNVVFHLECLLWDHARVLAASGRVAELLHALRDQKASPDRVRGLARAVGTSLDDSRDRAFLLDPEA